jgi:hypothetical protein
MLVPHERREQVRPVAGGRAGEDADEVVGIALRFHQCLASAVGTAVEVAALGVAAVERAHNRLGLHARFMHRPRPEVDQLLGMTDRPRRAQSGGLVSIVGCGHGVAAARRVDQSRVIYRSGPSAVALLTVLAVPGRSRRKPERESDFRIARGADDAVHFAVRGHGGRPCRGAGAGRAGKWAFGDKRRGDRRVRELDRGQTVARLLRVRAPRRAHQHHRHEERLPSHCRTSSHRYVLVIALNPSSSTEISRILNFWIFPVTVIGKSHVKRT